MGYAGAQAPGIALGIIHLNQTDMKKSLFLFLALGMFTFASCETREENTQERMEDRAEDVADDMEDAADDVEDEVEDAVN